MTQTAKAITDKQNTLSRYTPQERQELAALWELLRSATIVGGGRLHQRKQKATDC